MGVVVFTTVQMENLAELMYLGVIHDTSTKVDTTQWKVNKNKTGDFSG